MPIFHKHRVEEDLERIRKANLPPDVLEAEEKKEREAVEALQSDDVRITAKDVLAMIIAAFSIIIPYALLFIGVAVMVLYFFLR